MLSTLTRPYGDDYSEMDRYRNWQQSLHYYDEQTNPLHFSYAEGRSVRSAPAGRPDRILQDAPDRDLPASNSTRRRIAVACSRCRKRKIKCSGDTGNGLGCHNCRTAGVDSCNFFRVGSLEVSMNQRPVSALNSYFSPTNSERLHYLNVQQAPYYQNHQPLSIITRGLPESPYYAIDTQYDTESQADNYMLSPATPMAPQDHYGGYNVHDSSRNWSAPGTRYMSCYSRYGEHDFASYPYGAVQTTRRPTVGDRSHGTFSTSTLQMSLPNPVPGGRVLPPLTAGARGQLQASGCDITQIRPNTSAGAARSVPLPTYSKSAHSWVTGQVTSGTCNDSVRSLSSGETILQGPSSASSIISDNSALTLLPSSTASPGISPTTVTATDQAGAESSLPTHNALGITQNEHPMYSLASGSASETRLPHTGASSNLYTFSIARRQHSRSELLTSDDRQIGNASYVPLQYRAEPSDGVQAISSFRHNSINGRSHGTTHCTSVPIIGQDA